MDKEKSDGDEEDDNVILEKSDNDDGEEKSEKRSGSNMFSDNEVIPDTEKEDNLQGFEIAKSFITKAPGWKFGGRKKEEKPKSESSEEEEDEPSTSKRQSQPRK